MKMKKKMINETPLDTLTPNRPMTLLIRFDMVCSFKMFLLYSVFIFNHIISALKFIATLLFAVI